MEHPQPGAIRLDLVRAFVGIATDALADAREEIDALNVYPVPDGDTGTNMFLTMVAARDALAHAIDTEPGIGPEGALGALTRGALLGARGNSGVILSQMLAGIADRMIASTGAERNAVVMARALRDATDASYAAVGVPVEGTMLSVARAAAEAAEAVVDVEEAQIPRSRVVFTAAAQAAREALARTPEQLPTLARAGVVDAGGRGLNVILDAAETTLTGRRPAPVTPRLGAHRIPVPAAEIASEGVDAPDHALTADGPSYEVMYLLDAEDGDRVDRLRTVLGGLGDSLVVVGGKGLWNVHVHVDDVGAAIEAGIAAGRPHRIRVTHFAEQIEEAAHPRGVAGRQGRAVVAVAAGDGLAALFTEAGAAVVPGGPGKRPSAGMILDAIAATGAAEVAVLPNDPDSVRVAEVAARTAEGDIGVRVAVIPAQAQVQGLAALAVHEPGRSFDADVLEMTAAARHTRHGAVTVAAKAAITMGGPCRPGDILGAVEGDFTVVGSDLYDVAVDVLDRLLRGGGGELVTIVRGEGCEDGLADRCAAWATAEHPHVDAVVYDGGQPRYPLLVSVE